MTTFYRSPVAQSVGCLLGTAVGDALGLPCEGLSRHGQRRTFGEIEGYRLLFGRGMVSDDTEHTCMVAQALIASGDDPDAFASDLARRMRGWLLRLPAGIGYATLRALARSCAGVSPDRSGVFSAGNGPAMRSAILGVCYGGDPERLRKMVRASTRITHTDPKAEYGARAVALAAYLSSENCLSPDGLIEALDAVLPEPDAVEIRELLNRVAQSVKTGQSTEAFMETLGLDHGVSGYTYHTVPVALHAALRHPHGYRTAVLEGIHCGGDTDTVGAIVGGIVGAGVGKDGIPAPWLDGLIEWPATVHWMERLAQSLAEAQSSNEKNLVMTLPVPALLARNLAFLLIVLYHGFRRLLPPY
jgi:ADP-ribosyl-[dinitrogen reductase] hydrolase